MYVLTRLTVLYTVRVQCTQKLIFIFFYSFKTTKPILIMNFVCVNLQYP